jgi:hypothetical protein
MIVEPLNPQETLNATGNTVDNGAAVYVHNGNAAITTISRLTSGDVAIGDFTLAAGASVIVRKNSTDKLKSSQTSGVTATQVGFRL